MEFLIAEPTVLEEEGRRGKQYAQCVSSRGVTVCLDLHRTRTTTITGMEVKHDPSTSNIPNSNNNSNNNNKLHKRQKQMHQIQMQINDLEIKLQPTHGFMLKASTEKINQNKKKLLDLYAELNMLQKL